MEKPFPKAVHDFLIDRANDMDLPKVSPGFKQAEGEVEKITAILKDLLTDDGQKTLLKLDTKHNERMTAAAEVSYQRGFAEGIKLMSYLLSIS